jgi:3-oxoacyl-[acyl-carrier protein] reductase
MTPTEPITVGGRLAARVVLVTGGGHGIGRAYCRRLAREAAHVVVADLDEEAAVAVADSIVECGGSALARACDVRRLSSLTAVVEAAEERFGGIDGLINNAGMMVIRPISRVGFESISEDEWDEAMDINLKGTWLACRAAAPSMRRRGGGSIVNIGSGTFFLGPATRAHYVASKGGVLGLSRVLARELAPDGIRVNTLVPGSTLSEDDPSDEVVAMRSLPVAGRSIKRIEVPEDLVGAAVFFLSDDSAFVTGQALVVDGGGILH